jgi:antitoxin (DNA-binding transcriptional repressor) of toxin-antitoxin stability system
MEKQISKSKFKPRMLQFFREVERTGKALIITDRGKPVLKIKPYSEKPTDAIKILRNSVIKYEKPTAPVGLENRNLDNSIAIRSVGLPQPFHNDPADRIIIATAVSLEAAVITKDEKLLSYPHVKTIW